MPPRRPAGKKKFLPVVVEEKKIGKKFCRPPAGLAWAQVLVRAGSRAASGAPKMTLFWSQTHIKPCKNEGFHSKGAPKLAMAMFGRGAPLYGAPFLSNEIQPNPTPEIRRFFFRSPLRAGRLADEAGRGLRWTQRGRTQSGASSFCPG